MSKAKIDPDVTRKNDPAYWAAALVLAIQNANTQNEQSARRQLKRLGYVLSRASDMAAPEKTGGVQ
jgi:hypothetical protein